MKSIYNLYIQHIGCKFKGENKLDSKTANEYFVFLRNLFLEKKLIVGDMIKIWKNMNKNTPEEMEEWIFLHIKKENFEQELGLLYEKYKIKKEEELEFQIKSEFWNIIIGKIWKSYFKANLEDVLIKSFQNTIDNFIETYKTSSNWTPALLNFILSNKNLNILIYEVLKKQKIFNEINGSVHFDHKQIEELHTEYIAISSMLSIIIKDLNLFYIILMKSLTSTNRLNFVYCLCLI